MIPKESTMAKKVSSANMWTSQGIKSIKIQKFSCIVINCYYDVTVIIIRCCHAFDVIYTFDVFVIHVGTKMKICI